MVGVGVVRELYGVLMAERASRAILLTSWQVTSEARSFAEGKPVELFLRLQPYPNCRGIRSSWIQHSQVRHRLR